MTSTRTVILWNVLWLLVISVVLFAGLAVASWSRAEHVAPHPIVYFTPFPPVVPGASFGQFGPVGPTPHATLIPPVTTTPRP
jgi:hypothetical protein